MSRRVVLFGGTFDPVTTAHMAVADQACSALHPDEFWFLVDNDPGERKRVYAPAPVRLEMVRSAAAGDSRFTVSDVEIRRGGETYTAETMDELHATHPAHQFELLLGADAARSINAWRHADRLLDRERFDIINRSGEQSLTMDDAAAIGFDPSRTCLVEVTSPRLSSSDVRDRIANGLPVDGLVPEPALEIIRSRGMYTLPASWA